MIPAAQIEDDLARLAEVTDCVRTYSVDFGLDQIAGIAAKHGLKVMQGLWLSSNPVKNQYPDRDRGRARQQIPGHDPRGRGRQRGAVARRYDGDRPRRHHPRDQGAGARAGDLCRRLGILAAQHATWRTPSISSPSISCLIGRISRFPPAVPAHMSMPSAVRSSTRFRARKSSSAKSAGRAPVACAKARCRRRPIRRASSRTCSRSASARISTSTSSKRSTSRGSARSRARSAAIGDSSTPRHARRNSPGRRRCPIIRSGSGRASAESCSRSLCSARRSSVRDERRAALMLWLAVSANAIVGGALIGWTIDNIPIESLGRRRLGRVRWRSPRWRSLSPVVLSMAIMRGTPLPAFSRIFGPKEQRAQRSACAVLPAPF